jgi:hypothetical protein
VRAMTSDCNTRRHLVSVCTDRSIARADHLSQAQLLLFHADDSDRRRTTDAIANRGYTSVRALFVLEGSSSSLHKRVQHIVAPCLAARALSQRRYLMLPLQLSRGEYNV